ncbi:hypothetical protein BDB00DRAFT_563293 [Zychaea mexicana]|uniref:uncharacterized protein n=1 Tax=Zychaea mexicana TaxID=64656 RepID=UPI0022FF22F9|nr:uncharacterized protein BDB00DRAFT_563293 [Zychaea mexicana]KAI9490228.1 hypothetical protein BDB00DRAFT_563293 [Zychaea mexicana]
MSFLTFNSSLPYFASLHDASALEADIAGLSEPLSLEGLKIASPSEKSENENKFMNALQRTGNVQRTVNGAVALKSTEDDCLDLYYQLGVSLDTDLIRSLLEKAWRQDPEVALHIIWHTRSIHRGKSANDKFYTAFGWLLQNHPQTAIRNLHLLTADVIPVNQKSKKKESSDWDMADVDQDKQTRFKCHGYWKDLINICQIYTCNELGGPKHTGDNKGKFKALNCPRQERRPWNGYEDHRHLSKQFYDKKKQKEQHEKHQANKKQQREERHARITRLLNDDPCYRALHFSVARLFASQLQADLRQLEANRKADKKSKYALAEGISLAAKWAPTLGHSHDKNTLMATSIAELLFPPTAFQEKDETREHYLNKVREMYRKSYTSPLRQALDVTERKMASGQWTKIDFSHVPSKCMQTNSALFYKHAKDEFVNFLKDVALGKKSVSGATLQPHELVIRVSKTLQNVYTNEKDKLAKTLSPEALQEVYAMDAELANAQWKTLVESIKQDAGPNNETLGSSIAVCDMSGSMYSPYGGTPVPVWPAVGLSLVLAELAAPPFNGSVITFADNPVVVNIDVGGKLSDNVKKAFAAPVGYSTDFLAVFLDLLLPIAKKHNLKQEDMVKRLFVFSDMEFNVGFGIDKWETIYEQIKREYEQAGYKMPQLVWWNLAQERPTDEYMDPEAPIPVTKDTPGCAMIGGFSASLMKSFFEGSVAGEDDDTVLVDEHGEAKDSEKKERDEETPTTEMVKTLYHESFDKLVVHD